MTNQILITLICILIPILAASDHSDNIIETNKVLDSEDYLIGPEYFPTNTALKLVYSSSMGEAYAKIKKKGKSFVMDLRNDDFYFVQTVHVENDTIFLTKLEQEVDVFLFISSGSSVTYSRPYLRFPFPMQKNDTWNWEGVEYIDEENPDQLVFPEKYWLMKNLRQTQLATMIKFGK